MSSSRRPSRRASSRAPQAPDPLRAQRAEAELLLKALTADEPTRARAAAARFVGLPTLPGADTPDAVLAMRARVQHKHSLDAVARAAGATSWRELEARVRAAGRPPLYLCRWDFRDRARVPAERALDTPEALDTPLTSLLDWSSVGTRVTDAGLGEPGEGGDRVGLDLQWEERAGGGVSVCYYLFPAESGRPGGRPPTLSTIRVAVPRLGLLLESPAFRERFGAVALNWMEERVEQRAEETGHPSLLSIYFDAELGTDVRLRDMRPDDAPPLSVAQAWENLEWLRSRVEEAFEAGRLAVRQPRLARLLARIAADGDAGADMDDDGGDDGPLYATPAEVSGIAVADFPMDTDLVPVAAYRDDGHKLRPLLDGLVARSETGHLEAHLAFTFSRRRWRGAVSVDVYADLLRRAVTRAAEAGAPLTQWPPAPGDGVWRVFPTESRATVTVPYRHRLTATDLGEAVAAAIRVQDAIRAEADDERKRLEAPAGP